MNLKNDGKSRCNTYLDMGVLLLGSLRCIVMRDGDWVLYLKHLEVDTYDWAWETDCHRCARLAVFINAIYLSALEAGLQPARCLGL